MNTDDAKEQNIISEPIVFWVLLFWGGWVGWLVGLGFCFGLFVFLGVFCFGLFCFLDF